MSKWTCAEHEGKLAVEITIGINYERPVFEKRRYVSSIKVTDIPEWIIGKGAHHIGKGLFAVGGPWIHGQFDYTFDASNWEVVNIEEEIKKPRGSVRKNSHERVDHEWRNGRWIEVYFPICRSCLKVVVSKRGDYCENC